MESKKIVAVEISHRKAPMDIRERFVFNKEYISGLSKTFKEKMGCEEVFILSTCNRFAIYAYTNDVNPILGFFKHCGDISQYTTVCDDTETAVIHLFATAAGLESQAIGEHQILGQLKEFFELNQEAHTIGPVLNNLIRSAIHCGRMVRTNTDIGRYVTSLSGVAYEMLKNRDMELKDTSVALIGTGEMAALMWNFIEKDEYKNLYVVSRDEQRAREFARDIAKPIMLNDFSSVINDVDVIIGVTTAKEPIMCSSILGNKTTDNNILMIDLGMPRNFDLDFKDTESVTLYDLDDIKQITYNSMLKRQAEIPKANDIISEAGKEYVEWLNNREVVPVIVGLKEHVENCIAEELKWVYPKLGHLDDIQTRNLNKLVSRISQSILKEPIKNIKDAAQNTAQKEEIVKVINQIFNLN
ncbi:MAG: glutamyl-tRNA reductase [Bacteroidota bacterium]